MDAACKYLKPLSNVFLLVIIFLAGFIVGNFNPVTQAQNLAPLALGDRDQAFAPLFEAYDAIQNRYVDIQNIDTPELVDGAIAGMVEALEDPYSNYVTPEQYNTVTGDFDGDVEGIGVVIRTDEETGNVVVVSLIRGAAAEAAGVLPGDVFVEVDGRNVEGLDQSELANIVRGPAGSDVTITFRRSGELITLDITRVRFEVPNVEFEMLENNIAYISMAEFNSLSRQQLDAAAEELNVNETNGLIFDLRNNPGGLVSSAIDVASFFLEDGVLFYETFADGSEREFEVTGDYGDVQVPIVVLVNEGSASASELVSGALQDLDLATLVGETTFGKGKVQTIQQLSNNGGLRLTIARYLLPSRRWIEDTGVEPDLFVPYDIVEDGVEVDPQLDAAIEFLSGQNTVSN